MTRVATVPDGYRRRCRVCRRIVELVPSTAGDAVCPVCGSLNWFVKQEATDPGRPIAHNVAYRECLPEIGDEAPFTYDGCRDGWVFDLSGGPVAPGLLTELRRKMSPVVEVDLSGTNVTDEGLGELDEFRGLNALFLNETRVTVAAFPAIAVLVDLETLGLADTSIRDRELARLNSLTNLRNLDLSRTSICGESLHSLKFMERIEWLCLDGTRVSDRTVGSLLALRSLKHLSVGETMLSAAGVQALRAGLRECRISSY
ncbi:MAG: hypothetical protein KDA75_02995 [Planctomycetaceae bacterium]|nr:hypothetical protein [Planctomycetaceae bacterium]